MNRIFKEAEKAYSDYYKQYGFMVDLYKDVKRIVDTNDIDVSSGNVLMKTWIPSDSYLRQVS